MTLMTKYKAFSQCYHARMEAITTVSAALQQAARLLHTSPYATVVSLPRQTADRHLRKLLDRYPTITAHRNVRSALRTSGHPVVVALVMPPEPTQVTVLLLANRAPDDREAWHLADDQTRPLTWRNYALTTAARMQAEADHLRRPKPRRSADVDRLTWRLSEAARTEYRTTITRLIHSTKPGKSARRSGGPLPGTTRTVEGQHAALQRLGRHLAQYPGLNGINVDRYLLRVHMDRLWRQQHPDHPPPDWPRYPYLTRLPIHTAPLATLWPPEETP